MMIWANLSYLSIEANKKSPDQTAPYLGLICLQIFLSKLFGSSGQKFVLRHSFIWYVKFSKI